MCKMPPYSGCLRLAIYTQFRLWKLQWLIRLQKRNGIPMVLRGHCWELLWGHAIYSLFKALHLLIFHSLTLTQMILYLSFSLLLKGHTPPKALNKIRKYFSLLSSKYWTTFLEINFSIVGNIFFKHNDWLDLAIGETILSQCICIFVFQLRNSPCVLRKIKSPNILKAFVCSFRKQNETIKTYSKVKLLSIK